MNYKIQLSQIQCIAMKKIVLSVITLLLVLQGQSQRDWKDFFDKKYTSFCTSTQTYREMYQTLSKSPDAYKFMEMSETVDALLNMYIATRDAEYRNDEINIIDNILATAAVSKSIPGNIYPLKDDYLGWTSKTPENLYNNETDLFEGYVFRYIVHFLYELKKDGWANSSAKNNLWYTKVLTFVEKNIWEKWVSRSMKSHAMPYATFLRTRTHMASHWAYIGILLKELTQNSTIKTQCTEMYNMFDVLLKRNLRPNKKFPNAYIWNSTWDDVTGTQATSSGYDLIQDVSHGNHVISYITIAKRLGNTNWSDEEMSGFAHTVKEGLYNQHAMVFSDNVDGTSGSGNGTFQSDGWVKLGYYDHEVLMLYSAYAVRQEFMVRSFGMELQYYADLLLIERLLSIK